MVIGEKGGCGHGSLGGRGAHEQMGHAALGAATSAKRSTGPDVNGDGADDGVICIIMLKRKCISRISKRRRLVFLFLPIVAMVACRNNKAESFPSSY